MGWRRIGHWEVFTGCGRLQLLKMALRIRAEMNVTEVVDVNSIEEIP